MINPFRDVNWNPDLIARRAFAKSLMIGFPIIAALLITFFWLCKGHTWKPGFLWLGGGGALAGLIFWVVPSIAKPFYVLWYGIACSIGIVVSNAIVAAVYYPAVTPIGILLRLFGKDPMTRQLEPGTKSYWTTAEKVVDRKQYFRQF